MLTLSDTSAGFWNRIVLCLPAVSFILRSENSYSYLLKSIMRISKENLEFCKLAILSHAKEEENPLSAAHSLSLITVTPTFLFFVMVRHIREEQEKATTRSH